MVKAIEEYAIFVTLATAVIYFLYYLIPPTIRYIWQYYVISRAEYGECSHLDLPPGTLGYPLIGESLQFLRKQCVFYKEKVTKYGCIYKTHLFGRPTIRVIGAENVKKILLGENSLVTQNWPTSTRLLLGSGSITQSSGHVHKIRRKHMLHAFSLEELDKMVPIIQEVIRASLKEWKAKRNIFTYPESKMMAFTIAACTFIGLDVTSSRNCGMHKTFVEFLNNLMTIPVDFPGFGFRKGMNAKRQLISILRKLLPETDKRPFTSILKAYFESSSKLGTDTIEEINEGIIDLLFAGHETVASASTNLVMFLGKHQHEVEHLREELRTNDMLLEDNDSFTPLDFKIVNSLKYFNCVAKEVLRLCPPAGGGFRKALKSFELGGYLIPKDWTIIYSIRETQHLSPLFEHSERFDPSRWTDDKMEKGADRFHYIPFGFGARGCIGKTYALLVIKVFLIELVRTCDWSLQNENVEMRYIPIPVATDHLPATFCEPSFTCSDSG